MFNTTKNTRTTATNTVAASYNIAYHLWYPYHSISCTSNTGYPPYINPSSDSLIIALDSTNANHKITLVVSSQSIGMYSNSGSTPFNTYVAVYSRNSDVYLSTNSTGLANDSINANLSWSTGFNLNGDVYMIGCNMVGVWNCSPQIGYVGIKIVSSSGNRYGWIKVNAQFNSITMEAQALNYNYGQYIQVGQTH